MLTSLQVCFNAVAPLFLIMALGYGAKCLGAISVDAVPSLNKLAFRYFMPVMLFRNLYDSSLSHAVQPRLLLFAVAAVLAFCLNNFIIANSTIPTGSMQDTIMAGARVFGSRLKYTFGEVERGDIAIFVYGYKCKGCGQSYRETDEGVCPYCGREDKKNSVIYYVKRVIGMPGDHIEIKQTGTADASEFHNIKIGKNADGSSVEVPIGTVYVNGEAITETYLPEPMIVDGQQFPEVDVTVPEGSYYMLGDNRNNSLDARYWGEYNMVSRDKMVAKVYFKYWPLTDMGSVN